ncbi:von Willebrand factor type A domain-containing protein [Nonomuraea sp. NPDC023979]|uniref:vWA domain-containing protein n=1 Tax=Nonomuraea sp. NPDC023979 TaxID=3154796 RepID=UPI0033EA3332
MATVGIAGLLALAACGGPGGQPSAGERAAPQEAPRATAQAEDQTGQDRTGQDQDDRKNEEQDTAQAQISTFALDVDTASYAYTRRVLQEGRWPEPARIRPEEFVNSFKQDYAEPPDDGFTVHTDGARLDTPGQAVLRVGLQTRRSSAEARRPANLTFVIDVSGSMAETGRLDLVKQALHTLLDQLAPGDQVSVVAFSDQARVLATMTPLTARDDLHRAVDQLTTEGGTNLEAGLVLGYREAAAAHRPAATNRVILLSDGLANQGSTAWQAILDRVKEHAGRRITLLTVGVGREYGDELMEQLADNGDGAAVYVSTQEEADKIFAAQLPASIELRARDAKAQVVFNPSVVESYRLLGYENRALATEEFRDDSRDGGEIGPGHAVTALYSVRLKAGAEGQLATATVRWQDPDTRAPSEATGAVTVADLAETLWQGAPLRLQVDVLAAAFALHMRDGEAFGLGLPALGEHARRLAGAAEDPMVGELADLIAKAGAVTS